MQNAELVFRSPLTLLRRLFFLAARHSEQAPSALAPQRQFSVFRFPFLQLSANQSCNSLRYLGLVAALKEGLCTFALNKERGVHTRMIEACPLN